MTREDLLRTMGIGVGSDEVVTITKTRATGPTTVLTEEALFPKSDMPESWTPPPSPFQDYGTVSRSTKGKGSLNDLGLGPAVKPDPELCKKVQDDLEKTRVILVNQANEELEKYLDKTLGAPTVSLDTETKQAEFTDIPVASFRTGPAGSGKTFHVKQWAAVAPGSVILTSTTGISAVNLGENVITLNSLLGYFDTASLRDAFTRGQLDSRIFKLGQAGLKHLVIDEVSMMDGDQLVLIQAALDGVNEAREVAGEPPITLTLTGDFLQLPPIKSKFVFEVGVWEKYEANTTRLTKIWRQSDPDFLAALSKARSGHASAATDYFGKFCAPLLDPKFPGITLMAKNQEVDRYNQVKMLEIAAPTVEFKSETWGDARPEWKNIPLKLGLKVGALVMVLSNKKDGTDREKFLCVNGDIGTVHEFEVDKGIVWVTLKRNGVLVPVSYIQRDNVIPLEPGRAKQLRAEGFDNRIKDRYEIIGQVTYMPLRPSWASTVHRSQGLTLDHVQLDIRDNFYRSSGMVYVALSRVRTPAGLRIVGGHKVLQSRMNIDPRVKRWI